MRIGVAMDIREYVRVRIIPGGKLEDSKYLAGLMLRKNVAHKNMRREAVNPRILCIDGVHRAVAPCSSRV